jgi:hypothetical protein
MLRTKNLTLTSSPLELTIQDAVEQPNSIAIQNTSETQYVYIGDSNVSSVNYGYLLAPSQTISMDLSPYQSVFAVGDSGATIAVLILDQA